MPKPMAVVLREQLDRANAAIAFLKEENRALLNQRSRLMLGAEEFDAQIAVLKAENTALQDALERRNNAD